MIDPRRLLPRDPKWLLIALLVVLAGVAGARHSERGVLAVQLAVAVATALLAEWAFLGPVAATSLRSAAISGLLVGMILAPGTSLQTVWFAVVAAIASKRLLGFQPNRHVFNPATFGLVLSMLLFGNRLNWWGYSSPVIVILGAGFILFRMRRLSLPFSYFILRALSAALLGQGAFGADMLLLPNLFFAFIMVVEPKTSPGKRRAQWLFGGVCGVVASLCYEWLPSFDGDLLALITANFARPALEAAAIRVGARKIEEVPAQ